MFYLMTDHDVALCSLLLDISIDQGAFLEAALSVWAPVGLPRVIGPELILPLHLHGDDQVGRWIGIGLSRLAQFDVARHVVVSVNDLLEKSLRSEIIEKKYPQYVVFPA